MIRRTAMLMLLILAALALAGCRFAVGESGETVIEAATPTPQATPRPQNTPEATSEPLEATSEPLEATNEPR